MCLKNFESSDILSVSNTYINGVVKDILSVRNTFTNGATLPVSQLEQDGTLALLEICGTIVPLFLGCATHSLLC